MATLCSSASSAGSGRGTVAVGDRVWVRPSSTWANRRFRPAADRVDARERAPPGEEADELERWDGRSAPSNRRWRMSRPSSSRGRRGRSRRPGEDEGRDILHRLFDGADRPSHRCKLVGPKGRSSSRAVDPVRSRSKPTVWPRLRTVSAHTRSPTATVPSTLSPRTTRSNIAWPSSVSETTMTSPWWLTPLVERDEHPREHEHRILARPEERPGHPVVGVGLLAEVGIERSRPVRYSRSADEPGRGGRPLQRPCARTASGAASRSRTSGDSKPGEHGPTKQIDTLPLVDPVWRPEVDARCTCVEDRLRLLGDLGRSASEREAVEDAVEMSAAPRSPSLRSRSRSSGSSATVGSRWPTTGR